MIQEKFKSVIVNNFSEEIYNDIIARWNEPHRFHHNITHLEYILSILEIQYNCTLINQNDYDTLIISAFFHDVIYNPKNIDNEEKSIDFFVASCRVCDVFNKQFIQQVQKIIYDTKLRTEPDDYLSKIFWKIDNMILNSTLSELINYEHNIYKEYQFVDYSIYKEKRIEFLKTVIDNGYNDVENIENLIEYVNNRKPNVGLFAGSFNPFHIGHLDVLHKAEKIFDKVIIGFGKNPEKNNSDVKIPYTLEYRECIVYNGLITELISDLEDKNQNITLIRGIRNGNDLSYESNQLEFIKEIKPDVNVVYIPTDKQYEHISSSAIRNLEKFDKKLVDKYTVL